MKSMLNWVRVSEGAFGHLLTPESKLGMNSVISAKRIGEKKFMNRARRQVIESNEISLLRTYKLGEWEQKVMIDGKKKENPILIFLHGGPGTPIPFCEGCRGMFPDLTKKVTLVCWDQLGCGINDYVIDDSFHISRFVDMTVDLIRQIKNDFPNNKIVLFAVSWGSILAAQAACRAPELIDRVIVYGQVLKQLGYSEEVFEALKNVKMSEKDSARFGNIRQKRENIDIEDVKAVMGFIRKYTEGYQSKKGGKAPLGDIIRGLLGSPDYSLKDFKAVVINGYRKNTSLLSELMNIDLSEQLQKIKVPYLIMQGTTDIVTPTKMLEAYMSENKNENLKLEIVPDSGHMPGATGMERILEKLSKL